MQFNSYTFALFFLCFFAIYYAVRKKLRLQNIVLLSASYLFYALWDMRFLFILIVPTALDYVFAIMIQHGKVELPQRLKSAMAIVASFFVLIIFQYSAISFNIKSQEAGISIDRASILNPYGWQSLLIVVSVIVLLNVLFSVSRNWDDRKRRKVFLIISVVCSLTILCVFKYFNFFTDSFALLVKNIFGVSIGRNVVKIILPVGVSFYIFKTISYIVDVYRNKIESSKSFLDYAAYLSFFPQLLAGPIDRANTLLTQIRKARPDLTSGDVREAIWLFVWGLFKKVVVADNMSVIVNEIFSPYDILAAPVVVPEDGLRMLVGIYAFTIQIYGDFSGYTDMSRGIARLLGFNTMLNFNLPYFSVTPGVFWRRWHISLSTWLRDYLYIPLGGNRCSKIIIYRNTLITMLLGGLWHGASWTFVLWGGYHGLLLVIYRALGIEEASKNYPPWKRAVHGFITFNLIAFGWLLFRAKNMTTVAVFLQSIFLSPFGSMEAWEYVISIAKFSWFLLLFQVIQARLKNLEPVDSFHWFPRLNIWVYITVALLSLTLIRKPEFIYFAF